MKRSHVLVCISALLGLCLGAAAQDTLSLDLDTLDNKHVQVPPDKHESPDTQVPELTDTLRRAVISSTKSPVTTTGLKRIDHESLLKGVAVLGTPDVIKVLQNLPGVAAGMEFSSGLYVHGGDGSDNLFMLDGVPLFQVTHLGGLFSSFNTDIVESVDFYKSGFPARYGGKLSSVVDVRTRDGSMEKFGGSVSIGLIDGRLDFNGPIIRDKLSYDVAVRRSWLDVVSAPFLAIRNLVSPEKTKASYSLFDSNVNLTYTPTKKDKINFRFFAGTDNSRFGATGPEKFEGQTETLYGQNGFDMRVRWGNLAASSSSIHDFSEKSRLSTILYYSRGYSNIGNWMQSNDFSNDVVTPFVFSERIVSSANSAGLRSIYSLSLRHHNLSAGIEYKNTWYNPTRTKEETAAGQVLSSDSRSKRYLAYEASAFVEDEMTYGPFSLTAGLRLDGYFSGGAAYFRPQPRLSTSIRITDAVIAKASYEMMSQYSHLLSSLYVDLPTNLWMPATGRVRPSDSHQVAAGIYSRLSKHWHMDLGGYYRTINNCIIYSGTVSLFPPVDRWEEEFVGGKGRSYGAELEVRYISEKFTGAAYYTLSWTERLFEELYSGWFKDRFDNRHKLTLTCSWRISEKVDFNATWNYHSGNRVTIPEHVVVLPGGDTKYLYSSPYNAKMPDYHRLDLGFNFYRKTKRGNESIWNISIYNAYCRMNPIMMFVSLDSDTQPSAKVYSLVPILPTFSYTFKF